MVGVSTVASMKQLPHPWSELTSMDVTGIDGGMSGDNVSEAEVAENVTLQDDICVVSPTDPCKPCIFQLGALTNKLLPSLQMMSQVRPLFMSKQSLDGSLSLKRRRACAKATGDESHC